MKTLKEHNEERMGRFITAQRNNEPNANGIGCPECDDELWDSNPMEILASNPPQKNVHCPKCGYRGYRLA